MTGDVALTGAGNLKEQKYILHAVGPVWAGGDKNEEKLLKECVSKCLIKYPKKFKSISLPAISSGIFGFPKEKCAKIMIMTALEEIKNGRAEYLQEIRMTNFDDKTIQIFRKEMEQIMKNEVESERLDLNEEKLETKGHNLGKGDGCACVLI